MARVALSGREARFAELTPGRKLRRARFLGLRRDRPATAVVLERAT